MPKRQRTPHDGERFVDQISYGYSRIAASRPRKPLDRLPLLKAAKVLLEDKAPFLVYPVITEAIIGLQHVGGYITLKPGTNEQVTV